MNALTPYAAFIMRLAVGGVFLIHGITKFQRGIAGTAGFLASVGIPFSSLFAVVLIAIETVGAACVLLGIWTRAWAVAMAVVMVVAILAVKLPGNFELEALLLAGAVTLVALGDGPLSIAVRFKQRPS